MKNERGSALMTVILIVFVTATIGAAISSFIMMNYKLRTLDNKIGRAEYETEKIVDSAYLAIQEAVKTTIDEQFAAARTYIAGEIENERNTAAADGNDYNYGKVENGEYITSENKIDRKVNEIFVEWYKNNLHDNIVNEVSEKVEETLGITPQNYNENTFGNSGNTEIAIDIVGPDIIYGNVTEQLNIYYKVEGSPTIQFLVDFIIYTPTYEEAYAKTYNLNSLVGIANWNMQDWKYL